MSPPLPPRAPGRFTNLLRHTKVKLLYARITSTPCTTTFFLLSLITSIVLIVLQGITYQDNKMAVSVTSAILSAGNVDGFPIMTHGSLEVCTISNGTTTCSTLSAVDGPERNDESRIFGGLNATELAELLSHTDIIPGTVPKFSKRGTDISPEVDQGTLKGVRVGNDTVLSLQCVRSMVWINDTLKDAKREDLVTLAFHGWLFLVSVLTVVNESIPHLVAALAAHILGTAWAGARIQTAKIWWTTYRRYIMYGSCDGIDVLGDWWNVRARHAAPIVFINALSTFAFAYLSISIYRTYAKQSLSRAGASAVVQRIYKLVLLFSASLNLASFFNIASASIWISKVSSTALRNVADHIEAYQTLFIITLLLMIPWLVSGWISVRKESRLLFLVFGIIGIIPFVIATVMFTSQVYGFVFSTWPFFATVTITSYIFTITTMATGVVCRMRFGKGLAHFLTVEKVLENLDFTPVYLPKDPEKASNSDTVSLSGTPPFPDTPTTKHIRAVPSVSIISNGTSIYPSDASSDKFASRASSIFTVPHSRPSSSQAVVDIRDLDPRKSGRQSRTSSSRFAHTVSISSSILEVPEIPPVLAPISPLSSLHLTRPQLHGSSSLSVGSSGVSRNVTASTTSSASLSDGPARPPGLGLPSRPSEAVRPAFPRKSALGPARVLPSPLRSPIGPLPSPPPTQQS